MTKIYGPENWQDAIPFIGRPGRFYDDPDMDREDGLFCDDGILTEIGVCYHADGCEVTFYAETKDHEPLDSYYYFRPDVWSPE